MDIGLHKSSHNSCLTLIKLECSQQIYQKKITWTEAKWKLLHSKQPDMMQVIVPFHNFTNAPNFFTNAPNFQNLLMTRFLDNFLLPNAKKTFPKLELFPYCGQKFWRHILSSTLQNLVFLATEHFNTYHHNLLSPDCHNRHS
jgi:hypothetical protein